MSLKIINYNFFTDIFEKHKPNELYTCINLNHTNRAVKISDIDVSILKSEIHTFEFVPNYLKTETTDHIVCEKVFQKKGYAANLETCNSIDEYLITFCKSNFRNNIKRSLKRLESCFNIDYEMFYGDISYDVYTSLMHTFHELLSKRFQDLNTNNLSLKNWDYYSAISFNLIKEKKASLFVIFNENKPIAFALNFHFKDIFHFSIPTFHSDYYKFSLGNMVIYKNLEWCFKNDFKLFDMGYGAFENKVNWCNMNYDFEHHVLYHPKNGWAKSYAIILKNKYKLINYLISKNVNVIVKNLKSKLKGKKEEQVLSYTFANIENLDNFPNQDLLKINWENESFHYLKRPVYDFLYLNTEHTNNVEVFKLSNAPKHYIFKGKNNIASLQFTTYL